MEQERLKKYRPYPPVRLPDRTWPNQVIQQAVGKGPATSMSQQNQVIIHLSTPPDIGKLKG